MHQPAVAAVPVPASVPVPAATSHGRPGRASPSRADRASEFAPLLRTVKEQGLLEHRPGWYARGVAALLVWLTAVIAGMAVLGGSWTVLLLAPPLAVLCARAAFLAHDGGHAQIAAGRRANRLVQLAVAGLVLGMSRHWWNDKHNRHHANPNHLDKDPDVAPDVLIFDKRHAAGRRGLRGLLTRRQAWLFFPLTTLEGIALKVYGFRAVLSRSSGAGRGLDRRTRAAEALLLTGHLAVYAGLLLATMPAAQAVVFALLHHMALGLHLGMAFAPNHKGMDMPDGEHGSDWGHLRRQVLTSRNIRGGPVTDWFLGGLNYQIEHHLFPSMPRPHLRLAQPLVRAHCRALGIPYTETGLIDSYRQALRHLHGVGEPLRTAA
ncbi:fatty acid desaturase family protein [Streptomyces sp. PR69]|uniref:fatty acid desaturase family protein n=1 Tax=Streptomyces sp. PR69 TaxID=2984950 RepID=UPI002264C3D7|nr:acyl-CoA desaturase [Streptomyces sp. PR69]